MKKQNYSNHVRYYPPHHFIFLPLMSISTGLGAWKAYAVPENRLEWLLFSFLSFCIFFLAIMVRQHYALGNQDRIVRVEFRLRYLEISGKSAKHVEQALSFGQIAALRFASDPEFLPLVKKAVDESLKPDEIKRSIRDWKADEMRL